MNTDAHHPHTIDALGIDIGYFQTKFTLGRGGDRVLLLDKFPSHAERLKQHALPEVGGDPPDGVVIPIGGVPYFVGPGVFDVVSTAGTRHIDRAFTSTPEYEAFYKGSLHRIAVAAGVRSVLVVKHMCMGVPVYSLAEKRDQVVKMAEGEHKIPGRGGKGEIRVIVERVHVLAQPQGSILAEDIKLIMPDVNGKSHTTLVIDIGGGTFDWLVTTGLQIRATRSGSCETGTLACLEMAASALRPELARDPLAIAQLDRAMRFREPEVCIGAKSLPMARCWDAARAEMTKPINEMKHKVSLWSDVAHVLVTGGGASMFHDAIVQALPEYSQAIRVVTEPVTANVKGFHMYAENMAARQAAGAL